MSKIELISDQSNQCLQEVPPKILEMCNLRMLYLEGNLIEQLPDDFFKRLPKLTWLDLRNNRLKAIPSSISYNECLENLLLANNQIERLPTELGLVPTLKSILISGNPITYPSEYILEKGTEAICEYLRMEHLKLHPIERVKSAEVQTLKPEKPTTSKRPKSADVRALLRAASKSAMSKPPSDTPVITVKSLSANPNNNDTAKTEQKTIIPIRRRHKVTKSCSKITIRSSLSSSKHLGSQKSVKTRNEVQEAEMKQLWLTKLRELLDEQNKILQQEKNLKALSSWRFNKKTEPARPTTIKRKKVKPPYATDPAYDMMLSRQQLSEQIDRVIKDTGSAATEKVDIQKLIAEVVNQLKSLETSCTEVQSPRAEIENAGKQIQTILELHKKITNAKLVNDRS